MIESKEIPHEFVSIRQVWLKQIDRCTESISHRFMKDVQDKYSERSGIETVAESVLALYYTLIDYGEATIKTEVTTWRETKLKDKVKGVNRFQTYLELFEYIIQTLNKYGMLFESQPKGFTNVEMKSV